MAFDEGGVHYSFQTDLRGEVPQDPRSSARDKFRQFIKNTWVTDGADESRNQKFIYRDALRQKNDQLLVDLAHLNNFDANLGAEVEAHPADYLPLMEAAALDVLREQTANQPEEEQEEGEEGKALAVKQVQVLLKNSNNFGPSSIRDLTSDCMSKLVMVPGIVTAASKPKHKATHLTLQCTHCNYTTTIPVRPGMGGAMIPRGCGSSAPQEGQDKCPQDSYTIVPNKSIYIDQQTLKLQERPEDVPTGELPRSLLLVADRKMVGSVTPGTRVTAVGIYTAYKPTKVEKGGVPLQQPYIRLVGLQQEDGDSHRSYTFTPQEEQEFKEYAKQPGVHQDIFARIAPQIYGHDSIKQAVACLLFGGSRKKMPDGTWRRGDINVLMLGDPSTAKSQFLKFAAKVAPIAVYTSGKGSSAAGLTATVVQDASSREFYLEGGAMVLADNGVCCIDEFDKMRPEDRVAIHEAMEQQTISIAKAGITTMLKSRTSVLAAANPPSGRYDDLRSAADNIDLQSTILSRFDLIFIVKDDLTRDTDIAIAKHVLQVHSDASVKANKQTDSKQDEAEEAKKADFLKRYIHYCRTRCFPRLSETSATRLQNTYVKMRAEARSVAQESESDTPPVPMTVRQLEALVRLSESLARMQLQAVASEEHVEAALELFNTATMQAMKSGLTQNVVVSPVQLAEVHRIEEKVKRVLAIRQTRSERQVVEQLVGWGEREAAVRRAMAWMVQQGDLQYRSERRLVQRLK